MSRYGSLEYKIMARIARKKCTVFVREDFQDLSDYDQVGVLTTNFSLLQNAMICSKSETNHNKNKRSAIPTTSPKKLF